MKSATVTLIALCVCTAAIAAPVTLVDNAEAHYSIVLAADTDQVVVDAAAQLDMYLAKIAGVDELTPAPARPVRIEIGAAAQNDALRQRAAADESGYFVEVARDVVRLAGTTPTATAYAVYHLLEHLGCRWFMPGEIGEVVPRMDTIALERMAVVEVPDFTARHLQALTDGSETWALRNRLGGPYFPGAHSFNSLVPPALYFDRHPEYYALVDGKRQPTQLCTSNPEVIALVAESIAAIHRADPSKIWFGIGPNDGDGFCECDACRALDTGDWDPFSNEVSITDRFLTFANSVADLVHQEYPEIKFAFYAYHNYMRPPLKVKPDPSIIPALAPIGLCRLHGMDNPLCPERNYWKKLITDWGALCEQVYHRGYAYNLASPNTLINYTGRWAHEIPYCKDAGITGFRVETQCSWGSHGPLLYVMARLMWDADQDVDALLADYYDKFYGPASVPMASFWQALDDARTNCPYHTGNAINTPDMYPPGVIKRLEEHLRVATRKAKEEPYKERVHIAAAALEYLEDFLDMRRYAEDHQWTKAKKALDAAREVGQWMHDYDPPLLRKGGGVARIERFWAPEIEQAYERTTNGNRMVEKLPDAWRVFLDPNDLGEDLLYYSPTVDDRAWQILRTYSASWSDQGLRYYKGVMWYRTTVPVPATMQNRKLMLWLGGVDEAARVWVNGTYISEVETNGFEPVEFDITRAVKLGQRNLIAIRVVNEVVNELGTGGITRPAMIWSPAPGGGE